jgi:predicted rRNA pseudouridine synthase
MSDPLRPPPGDRDIEELLAFGVVNLDKPPGPSSHQIAAWVREMVDVDRAAHAGTLDPKVTGCLPLMLGDATRLARALIGPKEYVAVLELHRSAPADLDAVAAEFEGPILQKPPKKSAVDRSLRVREIHALDVLELEERRALLRIDCESGTYVRKLCHDLGLALGTGAHMGHLRRTASFPFDDGTLSTLPDLADGLAFAEDGNEDPVRDVVLPAERAIDHLPSMTIAPSAAREVANGAPVYAPGVLDADAEAPGADLVACHTPGGSAVCLGRVVGDPDAESGTVLELERVLV